MSDTEVVDQGTQDTAENPADNSTETTSQLPTGEPPEASEADTAQSSQTDGTETQATDDQPEGEPQTEAQKAEGRGKWDKERQKANERAALLEKQNAELIALLTAQKVAPTTATTPPPPAEPEVDLEAIHAEVEQATAKYEESLDPTDQLAAQKATNKLNKALLEQRKREKAEREKLEQAIKARDERDTVSAEDRRKQAALEASWKQLGIPADDGNKLVRGAFDLADSFKLTGQARQSFAEAEYARQLTAIKSKKSQATTTQTSTASATSVRTPAGNTRLTPRNSGVQPPPHERAQAAKLIAKELGL